MLNELEIRKMLVGLSGEELARMRELVRLEADQREAAKLAAFRPGDKVEFSARGRVHQGIVEYLNEKSVAVKVGMVRWRVAPCFLNKVA